MIVLATVVVTLAAALHIGIFVMESVAWARPAVWKRFGVADQAAADTTRPMAYNQGFYNLFLAIVTGVGIAIVSANRDASIALITAGTGSMLAAALVLATSDRTKLRAAAVQGLVPCLALAALALH